MKRLARLTRAYVEGLIEGRFGNPKNPRNPHGTETYKDDWEMGHRRGRALKHFADETTPSDPKLAVEVRQIRRATGEKV